jgi:transposase
MRALDSEVFDALWAGVEPLIPVRNERHPLGCHRPRKSDRDCFKVMMARLGTGCSWEDAEQITGRVVSDTTARQRRDEWVQAGIFDAIANEALAGYDKLIGLDLSEVAIDGSTHKAPGGGQGTGKSPVDRGKLGWKWSIATDRVAIPIGWATDGANCHDIRLLAPTLDGIAEQGLLADIETMWLDPGYAGAPTKLMASLAQGSSRSAASRWSTVDSFRARLRKDRTCTKREIRHLNVAYSSWLRTN